MPHVPHRLHQFHVLDDPLTLSTDTRFLRGLVIHVCQARPKLAIPVRFEYMILSSPIVVGTPNHEARRYSYPSQQTHRPAQHLTT